MIKKTIRMASNEVEVIDDTVETELFPGVTLCWKKSLDLTEEQIELLRQAWIEVLGEQISGIPAEPEDE